MSAKDWRGLGPGQMDSTRLGNGAHGRRWTDKKVIARAVGVGARRESWLNWRLQAQTIAWKTQLSSNSGFVAATSGPLFRQYYSPSAVSTKEGGACNE